MRILSVDTSCDETAAAITINREVLSNIVWSQASLHADFGGVFPSLAQREHAKRIDWIIEKALRQASCKIESVDALAVTVGPGLAVALEVGIQKIKDLALKYNLPVIPVNHVEAHILSPLASPKGKLSTIKIFPAFGITVSGGTTQLVEVKSVGKYKTLADTADDSLGEALDKAARLLGLGYPGGPVLEKFAKTGTAEHLLPLPLAGRESEGIYSYSGLKTAFVRLYNSLEEKSITKKDIHDLASSFQETAFNHFIKVTNNKISSLKTDEKYLLAGGGVVANSLFRKKIRTMAKNLGITPLFPYSKRLMGDNAGMIGVCAYLNRDRAISDFGKISAIDRIPKYKLGK